MIRDLYNPAEKYIADRCLDQATYSVERVGLQVGPFNISSEEAEIQKGKAELHQILERLDQGVRGKSIQTFGVLSSQVREKFL